jgi:hypothetical protein
VVSSLSRLLGMVLGRKIMDIHTKWCLMHDILAIMQFHIAKCTKELTNSRPL